MQKKTNKLVIAHLVIISISFLIIASTAFAQLRIGSFNTKFLGCEGCKDLQGMAKIIKGEDFSIVALQEVSKKQGVIDLVSFLGGSWEYIISPEVGRQKKEYYAFLWRGDKKISLGSSKTWDDSTDKFIREPFIAEFYHDNKIYWLINIHVLFKDNRSESIRERERELKELGKVFTWVNRTTKKDNSYTIILGDFNLTADQINKAKLPFRCYQTSRTTINRNDKKYVSSYDHFCLSEAEFSKLDPNFVRVKAPEDYYKKNFGAYWQKISDHVPIRMDISDKENLFDKSKKTLRGLFSKIKPN